ncbi:MAG: MnmC family methyltransferase [Persicimonas sp.]
METEDGSKSLYDSKRQLHYRSRWGACSESRHVFVDGTRVANSASPWRVLELGFGAAINFGQTVAALLEQKGERLEYHAVEYAPVAPGDLSFHTGVAGRLARRALQEVGRSSDPVRVEGLEGRVELWLHPVGWLDFERPDLRADAVYFDPFGPRNEPDSWTIDCFVTARRHMAPEALLGTYSAATAVKRAMFAAGFHVATAPGPGPKREITFASPSRARLEARPELELLDRRHYLRGAHD